MHTWRFLLGVMSKAKPKKLSIIAGDFFLFFTFSTGYINLIFYAFVETFEAGIKICASKLIKKLYVYTSTYSEKSASEFGCNF